MIPISFGQCFGWLHPAASSRGFVLCGAHPFEQLSAQRAWRGLAEELAARGYPTLRFDYPGVGDSLDPDEAVALVDWTNSIRAAVDWMRVSAGVDGIILVGLRLGAALAAEAACATQGVEGLVLLAPVISGRAYLRELTVTAAMVGCETAEDGFELGGFPITAATAEAIRRIDLMKLPRIPASEILLLTPPTQNREKLAAALRGLGARVADGAFEFLTEFLDAPTFSRPPQEAFDALIDWARTRLPPKAGTPCVNGTPAPRLLVARDFTEEPAAFGPSGALVGVLCRPSGSQSNDLAVIFVNSGANPHVGWARMNVAYARGLARAGIASFRMDLAGLGDSASIPGRPTRALYSLDARADVVAAIDWLQARGLRRAIVVGLCSGAHLAYHASVMDGRIAGVVIVNVQRFVWKEGDSLEVALRQASRSTTFYQREILKLQTWKRLIRGEIALRRIGAAFLSRRRRVLSAKWTLKSRMAEENDIRAGFERIIRRGARVLAVFSEGDAGIDELAIYMGAGGKHLLRLRGARIAFIEDADHNLTPRHARDKFLGILLTFLREIAPEHSVSSVPARETSAHGKTLHAQA